MQFLQTVRSISRIIPVCCNLLARSRCCPIRVLQGNGNTVFRHFFSVGIYKLARFHFQLAAFGYRCLIVANDAAFTLLSVCIHASPLCGRSREVNHEVVAAESRCIHIAYCRRQKKTFQCRTFECIFRNCRYCALNLNMLQGAAAIELVFAQHSHAWRKYDFFNRSSLYCLRA